MGLPTFSISINYINTTMHDINTKKTKAENCKKIIMKEINHKMPLKCSSHFMIRSLTCLFLVLRVSMVNANPPEDTIKCSSPGNTDCTITNYLGEFPDRSICRASKLVYPTTEEELFSIVANASMNNRKVKVVTRHSHSVPKLICTDGKDGLLISTKYLNRILAIDKHTMTMTVESGVMLRDLIEQAAEAGMALPHSPYWWGLSIGGMISTGAHGSSLWGKGSAVHEYVERIRIVHPAGCTQGYAQITTLDNSHPHLDAVKVSLGVLGVISQVTLRLQPLFKRSITFSENDESNLGLQATNFGHQHEFADITWYPSQRKVVYRIDDRVSSDVSGNGLNDYIGYRSTPSIALAVLRSSEVAQELANNVNGKCISAKLTSSILKTSGYGFTNDGILFTGYPIIGYQNRLQSSGSCLDSPPNFNLAGCPFDMGIKGHLFYHIISISIGLSNVKNFIEDVQKLRDLEPKAFCGAELYDGILMRYVKGSRAYLGEEEDCIVFDIAYYRSHDPMKPRLFENILEEVEQLVVFKYKGIPHWGKNRNIAFGGVIKKYGKAREFLKVKEMYDPLGLFSSQWTDQLLGLQGGVTIMKDGCALEGLCICSQDSHCAPKMGYFCRPGRVYKDARVCTRLS